MQPAPAPAPPPGTPQPPPSPPPGGAVVGVPGGQDLPIARVGEELAVPTSRAEVRALEARGERLSTQITSAQRRRDAIAEELAELPAGESVARTGLEQRLAQLDARILDIERAIEMNGRLLAAAPPSLLSNAEEGAALPFDLSSGQVTGIAIVSTIFVGMPLAVGAAVMMWRRANRPTLPPIPPATQQRLERMEQAIDTIAIEVERVSENQRFITRVLTDGPAQPLELEGGGERVPVRRDEA